MGASPLVAQASTVGTSERFWVYDYLSDGTIFLVADNNGYAVTAPNGGASPLIANADHCWDLPDYGLSSSERFTFEAVQPYPPRQSAPVASTQVDPAGAALSPPSTRFVSAPLVVSRRPPQAVRLLMMRMVRRRT
ncbi:fascin domain-containing protein [Plantactinospora sp. CA-294935]|uniref:fascin domain-containing protein n=1 Tax=Plantactinospora sp. CA-294935 TaxID=3240012 RepID=UPI003D8EDF73